MRIAPSGVPVLRFWITQAQPLPLLNNFDIQSAKRSACALVVLSGRSENRVTFWTDSS
jgi:hypothetical protein